MSIAPFALLQTLSIVVWAAGFALFIFLLRRRWLARYTHGFFIALAAAIAGGVLMSAVLVGRWGYTTARQGVEAEIRLGLGNVAAIIEGQVGADIRNTRSVLEQLAGLVAPMLARPDASGLGERLRLTAAVQPRYLQLRIVSSGGDVLATSAEGLPEPLNRVAVAYGLDGTAFVSEPFKSRAFGREVMTLAQPVTGPDGAVIAVITAVFDLQSAMAELAGAARFNASGYAVIVDGEGDVIGHPDPARIGSRVQSYEAVQRAWITQGTGSVVGTNLEGRRRLYFYRAIKSPSTLGRQPWVVLAEIDEAEELAALSVVERELLVGIGLLVIVSLVLAHQTADSIERPLVALKQFAARLGGGDLEARTEVAGADIAGSLAASMTSMAAGLRERDRVKEVFGRYIATQVSERILKGDVNLGGEARVVTILFSDIRNFTGMAEQMTPQQVVSFLNAYFSEMVEAVFEQGGVLDKFIGDGMMAVFGSLGDQPDHAARAVRAALRMKALLGKINADRAIVGKPPMSIGIGIHTDEVIVGNIGSTRRLEYTVVGDGVNTSSRVQALNKEFGTTILITDTTYEAVRDEFTCRPMPDTPIRGKQRPIRFFEVVSSRDAAAAVVDAAGRA